MSIEQILVGTLGQQQENREPMPALNAEANVEQLKEAYAEMGKVNHFSPGDLVAWKPGLCNKRYPRPGQPAIVQEVLAEPLTGSDDRGSTYSTDRLDMIIGIVDSDGDYVTWYAESRRFRPFRQAEAGEQP